MQPRTSSRRFTDGAIQTKLIDGSSKTHDQINQEFGNGDFVTTGAYDFIEHVSPYSRLQFHNDWPVGTYDTNGVFMNGVEVLYIVSHKGMLFASTGLRNSDPQGDPTPGPQILRKDSSTSPWVVDASFGTGYLSAKCLQSITLTTDQYGATLDPPVTLLMASVQDIQEPFNSTVWTRNDSNGTWTGQILLAETTNSPSGWQNYSYARIIFAHKDTVTGVHNVFAGLDTSALYCGAYDQTTKQIVWNTTPEITGTERMLSAAEANGVLYLGVGTDGNTNNLDGGLFRRVDGLTPSWEFIYEWPDVPGKGSGLRGLTAVSDPNGSGHQVLIGGLESAGTIIRIDPTVTPATVVVEYDYGAFFTNLWGSLGGAAELSAYNNMWPVTDPATGRKLHLIGLWVNHPKRTTPPFNGSYYLVRHPDARYEWGRIFDYDDPVADGSALTATRTWAWSPFPGETNTVLYAGGFDAGAGYVTPMHDTAWIYRAELPSAELPPMTTELNRLKIERIGTNSWALTIAASATNNYQLQDTTNLLSSWTNYSWRITGTDWSYLTVWTNATGAKTGFVRALVSPGTP